MDQEKYQEVLNANIAVHSRMAADYNTCEPHFRAENIEKVTGLLKDLVQETRASRLLDLGCGTGFIINIAKKYVSEIQGVDATPEMLQKVDRSGECAIELASGDTGTFPVKGGHYDLVTAYSFLHHLYDIGPTLQTAYSALRPGGKLYADLEPNFYFWKKITALDRHGEFDPVVKREIEMVTYKNEDIQENFGVSSEVFNNAEYGKNIAGGFEEGRLRDRLREVGFQDITIFYHWFIGQGALINDTQYTREERFGYAQVVDRTLQRALPLSKSLFKYLGFIAAKG